MLTTIFVFAYENVLIISSINIECFNLNPFIFVRLSCIWNNSDKNIKCDLVALLIDLMYLVIKEVSGYLIYFVYNAINKGTHMLNKYKSLSVLNSIDKGVLFMLLSALISAMNGAVAKVLSESMDPIEVVFYRNFLGVVIILFTLKKIPVSFNTSKLHLLFLRGLFGALAMLLFFYTIAYIPLGEAVILNKTSPFFVTILAYYLMKETINTNTIFALIIGFVGIVLIIKPFGIEISHEHIMGILGGFFAAAAYATIKKIKNIYDARIIMLSFMGTGMILPLLLFAFTPYVEFQIYTDPFIWMLIVFMAIISTASQWFLTRAYSLSPASIIGVVSYTNIPFAVGFGVMLGDSFPDMLTFGGIALIVLGGILVSRQSSSKK